MTRIRIAEQANFKLLEELTKLHRYWSIGFCRLGFGPSYLRNSVEVVRGWRWRMRAGKWVSGQGNMTWDLLLLCSGLGPVGTIRSDSKCAMCFICGSRYLASISRLRNLSESMAGALAVFWAFLLQFGCWLQTRGLPRWISLRNLPCRPTSTFQLCSTSVLPVACVKTWFLVTHWTNFSCFANDLKNVNKFYRSAISSEVLKFKFENGRHQCNRFLQS